MQPPNPSPLRRLEYAGIDGIPKYGLDTYIGGDAEREEEVEQKVAAWRDAPFLVIDECFTKGQVTLFQSGYQKAFINTFLKYRLETKHLATCAAFLRSYCANCYCSWRGMPARLRYYLGGIHLYCQRANRQNRRDVGRGYAKPY